MILVSLHTKSSSMFHAEFVYNLFPPKWRILSIRHYHPYLFFAIQQYRGNRFERSWVRPWIARRNQYGAYHALVQELSSEDPSGLKNFLRMDMATFNELFVDDVVTSWPQTNMFYPKVCIMQLLKVAWCRVIALFTLYILVYDTSIMIHFFCTCFTV